MPIDTVTIYLDDKRRAVGMWWQKMQHAVGGVPLLVAGIHGMADPVLGHRAVALAEIIVAAVLLVTLARDVRAEARALRSPHDVTQTDHRVGPEWFDVAAGLMLILEAWRMSHPGGKAFYLRPYFLLGTITLLLGAMHGPYTNLLRRRRFLRVDDEGVHGKLSRFRKIDVRWTDVRDVRVETRQVVIATSSQSITIPLRRYRNAGTIRRALEGWRERLAAAEKSVTPVVDG